MNQKQYTYFRCEWKIPFLSANEIQETFIGTGNDNCGLFFEAPRRNEEGYWTVGVIARVTSRGFLDQFISNFGAKAGLSSWTPVDEENWTAWHTLTASSVPEFIQATQQFGRANAELDAKSSQ
jgi:hypothetical protein